MEGRRAARTRIAGYYFQAINKDAPHPAAARLWEEFLYRDEGQNLLLGGGARPVRADVDAQGRHDRHGGVSPHCRRSGHPGDRDRRRTPRPRKYLVDNWAKAIG